MHKRAFVNGFTAQKSFFLQEWVHLFIIFDIDVDFTMEKHILRGKKSPSIHIYTQTKGIE